jgi:hypothetical protein
MKKDIKKDLLKMLRNDMKGMMMEEKGSSLHDMMPEKKAKVTVMADDEEGLIEGLSKAEQMMKMKFGEESEKDKKKK